MSSIEDELRALYADPPGTARVEAAIHRHLDEPAEVQHHGTAQLALAGLAATTVATLAVGAVVIADRGTTGPKTGESAAGRPTASSSPTLPLPDTVTVTSQVLAQTLITLLPRPGTTTGLRGAFDAGQASAQLVYDDGHGAALLSVGLEFPFRYKGKVVDTARLCTAPPMATQHCATRRDGSQLETYQGDANVPGGAIEWDVSVRRTDGVVVDVTEWNSPQEKKESAQTRPRPPFTMAELRAIAESPQWQVSVPRAAARQAAHLFRPTRSGG